MMPMNSSCSACTPAGLALREHVSAVQAQVEITTGLSAPELADLREQLHLVARRLRAHAASASAPSGQEVAQSRTPR